MSLIAFENEIQLPIKCNRKIVVLHLFLFAGVIECDMICNKNTLLETLFEMKHDAYTNINTNGFVTLLPMAFEC